ncbi:unnamed protein product [Effrenium voratum]|uniref:Dienelactone hydrolase domain-containing protein n=1 Tax=Effrenium voratum TaxID=2562239 RepID=A0AA36MTN6_9DINO|nr:unnamed protein product [Effrenium voratum]CAJ1424238.1 unnamed protein product [Effrenium voratum]
MGPWGILASLCVAVASLAMYQYGSFNGPCCTSRAHPPLYPPEYEDKGREIELNGIPVYEVAGRAGSQSAVLVLSDVFGWRSGRTRQLCDQLSAETGHQVLLPNLFYQDGSDHTRPLGGWGKGWWIAKRILYYDFSPRADGATFWPTLLYPIFWAKTTYVKSLVEDLLSQVGGKKVGVLGFCFGGWIALHLAAEEARNVQGIVVMHPSMNMEQFKGGDPFAVYQAIRHPTTCLAASDDFTPSQLAAMSERSSVEVYQSMRHGFVPRGDIKDAGIKEAVSAAMEKAVNFFKDLL